MKQKTGTYLLSTALITLVGATLVGWTGAGSFGTGQATGSSASTTTGGTTAGGSTDGTNGSGATTTRAEATTAGATTTGSTPADQQGKVTLKTPTAAEAAKIDPNEIATIKTNLGTIVIRFFKDKAPITVASFIQLTKDNFYNGTRFHRVIPNFMIQGGDPLSKGKDRSVMGTGDPGYNVPAEFNDVDFQRGIVGLARAHDPNSGGSQFFIMQANGSFLNKQYCAFGQVITGLDVVDKIVNLKRDENDNPLEANPAIIESITLSKGDPKTFPVIPIIKPDSGN